MSSIRSFRVFVATAALLCGASARGAGRDCTSLGPLRGNPTLEAAKVAGGKTFFVKDETDNNACPAASGACRRKAFLLPGNAIVVSGRTGGFVCATFVNGKGVDTSGWLPAAAIEVEPPGAPPLARDWAGAWVRQEAEIRIEAGAENTLAIHGDATWGERDPDRVERGAVNTGEIAGTVSPAGDRLSFTMVDEQKTLPVNQGRDTSCKVWMRRVGSFLLVDDNDLCGGVNVSFRGAYARR